MRDERERERERKMGVFLKSSGLLLPQIRHWLDPTFSHDALQAEILEVFQAVARGQRENFI